MIYILGKAEEWLLRVVTQFGNYEVVNECGNAHVGDVAILTNYYVKCDKVGVVKVSIIPRVDAIYTERALMPGLIRTSLRVAQAIQDGDFIKSLLNLGFTRLIIDSVLNPLELKVSNTLSPGSLYTIVSIKAGDPAVILGRGTGRGTLLLDAAIYNGINWSNAYIASDDLIREVQLLCGAFNLEPHLLS